MNDAPPVPRPRPALRRVLRATAIAAAVVAGLVAAAVTAALYLLPGPRLAGLLAGVLPDFEGNLTFRAMYVKPRVLWDLLLDRPTPVVIEGLQIADPEGTPVLVTSKLSVKIPLRSAMGGRVFLHDLELAPGTVWRFSRMKKRPGIGFTAWFAVKAKILAAAKKTAPPSDGGGGFLLQIVNCQLDGFTAIFDFPAWGLELRDILAPATLVVEQAPGKPLFVGWDVKPVHARKGGFLRISPSEKMVAVLPFDDVDVARVATTREKPNDILLDVRAAKTGATTLIGKVNFSGIYGYNDDPTPAGIALHADLNEASDALAAVVSGLAKQGAIPSELSVAGTGARVVLDMSEPFERLKIGAGISNLDIGFGPYRAQRLQLGFSADLGDPMAIGVTGLKFEAPDGGAMLLDAGLRGDSFSARPRFKGFSTGTYLPKGLRRLAGGTLQGGLDVSGTLAEARRGVTVRKLDLALTRSGGGKLPKHIRITGNAEATAAEVRASGIKIEIPGASAVVKGRLGLARKAIELSLKAAASNLPRVLRTFGIPALAQSAGLEVTVAGTATAPTVSGTAVVRRLGLGGVWGPVPEIPELIARFSLTGGDARLETLEGAAFGGTIAAKGSMELFRGTVNRLVRSPVVEFRFEGQKIDLASLIVGGALRGHVDIRGSADGPIDKLRARVRLPAGAQLVILGDVWTLDGVDVETDLKSIVVKTARLSRPSGGSVQLTGRMAFTGDMAWTVTVEGVPVEAIPGIAEAGVPIKGVVALQLSAMGSMKQPQLKGQIDLRGIVVENVRLGDANVAITTAADGTVNVKGALFGRLNLLGSVRMKGNAPEVMATLRFDHLKVEEFLPQLAAHGDARAELSGTARIELVGGHAKGELTLQDLILSVARPAPQLGRIEVRNLGVVHAEFSPEAVTLDELVLATNGGELRIGGGMKGTNVNAKVAGFLNLELLRPFLGATIERLSGDARLGIQVGGPLSAPAISGQISIATPVVAKLTGFVPEVSIPSGIVKLIPGRVSLQDLSITVQGATLTIGGSLDLVGFVPQRVAVNARGEVSAGLLETVAAGVVSEASGRLRLDAQVSGPLGVGAGDPEIKARMDIAGVQLRLRDLGRDVEVQTGVVELSPKELVLRDVVAVIDGKGKILIGGTGTDPGRITLSGSLPRLQMVRLHLPLQGRQIDFSVPGSVEIDDLNFGLLLTGEPEKNLTLTGDVRIASGRYVRDFTMRNFVLSPSIDERSTRPMVDADSMLAKTNLDLRVRTVGDSFTVQNNLAPEIHMLLDLHIGGDLLRPQIGGDVRPTDGRFHIIGIRGDFVLTPNVNHVTFIDTRSIGEGETPELALEAENQVNDTTGREHTVRMRITGPIGQARIDLSTDTGLDRSQTMLLLVSGRGSDRSLSGPSFGANVGTGRDVVGQLTRDSVADLIEPYIDDTLQLLTGRKVNLRPTVGPDGFELRVGARVNRQLELHLSYLRGFLAQQRYRAEGRLWLMDYLTLRGVGDQITGTPEQGIVEKVSSWRLELGLDYPIRFGRP